VAIAVLDRPAARSLTLACWREGAAAIFLWGAVLLLIAYPLLMVIAAIFSPAALGSPPLSFADLLSERLIAAARNTLTLGVAVSFLGLTIGAAMALLAAQTRHDRWLDALAAAGVKDPMKIAAE